MPGRKAKVTHYENVVSGRVVTVTEPAKLLIGLNKVGVWVLRLSECMADLGIKRAYISRNGTHIDVNMEVPERT